MSESAATRAVGVPVRWRELLAGALTLGVVLAGLLMLNVSSASAAAGSLVQLGSPHGCLSQSSAAGCDPFGGFEGSAPEWLDVATEPGGDGISVYLASLEGIAAFSRNFETGELTQMACVNQTGNEGCTKIRGIEEAFTASIAISSDGSSLYLADNKSLLVFSRNPSTGAISQAAGKAGCFNADGDEGCTEVRSGTSGFLPSWVRVSPDGSSVYTGAGGGEVGGILWTFKRDTTSGALTLPAGEAGCVSDDGGDGGGGSCKEVPELGNTDDAAFSPDSAHVYVLSTYSHTIVVFVRDGSTGELTPLGAGARCVVDKDEASEYKSCEQVRALHPDGGELAISPDGHNLYASDGNGEPGGVSEFDIQASTGGLVQPSGTAGCLTETGKDGETPETACTHSSTVRGTKDVDRARDIDVSADGLDVYVAGETESDITTLARNGSGVLSDASCIGDNESSETTCTTALDMGGLHALALAPDGLSVYGATQDGAVAFARTALPLVQTLPASGVEPGTAALNGAVNPLGTLTTYHFEYGPDTGYGTNVPAPDATVGEDVGSHGEMQVLTGLAPGTYHYRIVATSSIGTSHGADESFTVPAPPGSGPAQGESNGQPPQVLKTGQLGVINPLHFVAPSSTEINPLFHLVASSSKTVSSKGESCILGKGCAQLNSAGKSGIGQCSEAIGGNADLAITASCLKETAVGGTAASPSYTFTSTGPVSANGVLFIPRSGQTLTVTETTGSNAAEQFTISGSTTEVTFESIALDAGSTTWTLSQLAGGGFDSSWSHGGAAQSGAAPVPSSSTFNGLKVASATMPSFQSGKAQIAITLQLPGDLGGTSGSQPVTITNGTLAHAVEASSEPLFATGTAVQEASSCAQAEQAPVPSGGVTVDFPALNYDGVGIQNGSLTIAGPLNWMARVQAGLPFPFSGTLDGVLEVYQGTLRFGCVAKNPGPTMGLPNIPLGIQQMYLGFADEGGKDTIAGSATLQAAVLSASGGVVLSAAPPLSGEPWSLHVEGNASFAGIIQAGGYVNYSSAGYLQVHASVTPLNIFSVIELGPLTVNGALDPHGNFLLEGSGGASFAKFEFVSAEVVLSNIGIGACGSALGVHGGFTKQWTVGLPSFFASLHGCEDLSEVRPSIEPTCQQRKASFEELVSIGALLKEDAEWLEANSPCVNVPGSAKTARVSGARLQAITSASHTPTGHLAASSSTTPPGRPLAFQISKTLKEAEIHFTGAGGAPQVTLLGPSHRRITTPQPGSSSTGDSNSAAIVDTSQDTTTFAVANAARGTWVALVAPSSVPVTSVGIATPLPQLKIKASVHRAGAHETLHYRISQSAGRKITFYETGGTVEQRIGTARGTSGTLRFNALGLRQRARRITATVSRGPIPSRTIKVISYTAPALKRLPPPRSVRVTVSRGKGRITFAKVSGASAYRIAIELSDGRHYTMTLSSRTLDIPGLDPGTTTINASVVAIDGAGREGTAGKVKSRVKVGLPKLRLPPARHARRSSSRRSH